MLIHDIAKPVQVFIVDGHRRTWKTLWLLKRPVRRLIFAGYIDSLSRSTTFNGIATMSLQLKDGMDFYRYRDMSMLIPVEERDPQKSWAEGDELDTSR